MTCTGIVVLSATPGVDILGATTIVCVLNTAYGIFLPNLSGDKLIR